MTLKINFFGIEFDGEDYDIEEYPDDRYQSSGLRVSAIAKAADEASIAAAVEAAMKREEEHRHDEPCWCINCRAGGGTIEVETVDVISTSGDRQVRCYRYITGSGHGTYEMWFSDTSLTKFLFVGSERSFQTGSEYVSVL